MPVHGPPLVQLETGGPLGPARRTTYLSQRAAAAAPGVCGIPISGPTARAARRRAGPAQRLSQRAAAAPGVSGATPGLLTLASKIVNALPRSYTRLARALRVYSYTHHTGSPEPRVWRGLSIS